MNPELMNILFSDPERYSWIRELSQPTGMAKPESAANIAGFEWWTPGPWSADATANPYATLKDRAEEYSWQGIHSIHTVIGFNPLRITVDEAHLEGDEQMIAVKARFETDYITNEPRRRFVKHMVEWRHNPANRFEANEADVKAAKQCECEIEYYRQRNLRAPGEARDLGLLSQAHSFAESQVKEAMKHNPYLKKLGKDQATIHLTVNFINRQMIADFRRGQDADFAATSAADATPTMLQAARQQAEREWQDTQPASPGATRAPTKTNDVTDEALRDGLASLWIKHIISANQLQFK